MEAVGAWRRRSKAHGPSVVSSPERRDPPAVLIALEDHVDVYVVEGIRIGLVGFNRPFGHALVGGRAWHGSRDICAAQKGESASEARNELSCGHALPGFD